MPLGCTEHLLRTAATPWALAAQGYLGLSWLITASFLGSCVEWSDVPAGGANGASGSWGGAAAALPASAGGSKGANPALTSAQQVAQAALCNGSSGQQQGNGLVPVRTGLAWATLGVHFRNRLFRAY